MLPKEILKKYWGYENFRPLQENIINEVLTENDVLCVLSTGGGKSLCYQIPALYKEGVCIVISPLIALIEDQIDHLKNKGIKAASIPSKSSIDDIIRIFDNIKVQKIPFLYLSPERFQQHLVQDKLKQIDISFFAIDEAHCISEWGHDFRPSYLTLSKIKEVFPNKNIIALTATATEKTQQHIVNILQLRTPKIFKGDFTRNNLLLQVYKTPNKFDLLIRMLRKINGYSIIYIRNRIGTLTLHHRLTQLGLQSTYYHAGLNAREKDKNFSSWQSGHSPIMIATNAFGMGIDKNNVRLVVHLEIPNSIENYIQEAGRAGRDGFKSFACTILSKNDEQKFKKIYVKSVLSYNDVKNILLHLYQFCNVAYGELPENIFDFDLDAFSERYLFKKSTIKKALYHLHNYEIISFKEHYKALEHKVRFISNSSNILKFAQHSPNYQSLIDFLLRNYTGIFDILQTLNIYKLSKSLEISPEKLIQKLKYLHKIEMVEYEDKKNHYSVQFLLPREDKKTLSPFKKTIKQVIHHQENKYQHVWDFFNNDHTCRNSFIVNYFTNQTNKPCGNCDICRHEKVLFKESLETVYNTIKTKKQNYNDLLILLGGNHQHLTEAISQLLDTEKIILKEQYYQIHE